jgi:hypothetical protein
VERGARAIVAINNGDNWNAQWISTAFFPNTELHDYRGARPDNIWTNQDGWVEIAVPACSCPIWGPVGVIGGFAPTPRGTVQQFEMADDLGDRDPTTPQYGGHSALQPWGSTSASLHQSGLPGTGNLNRFLMPQTRQPSQKLVDDGTSPPKPQERNNSFSCSYPFLMHHGYVHPIVGCELRHGVGFALQVLKSVPQRLLKPPSKHAFTARLKPCPSFGRNCRRNVAPSPSNRTR